MPNIIPIKDLKDAVSVSALCKKSQEPVFITKNGYGDMVIMSIETYEKHMLMQDVYEKLAQAQDEIDRCNTVDALSALKEMRKIHAI